MDFRAWLVMQGWAVYLSALADPDRLARMRVPFGEAEWELCGYIAMYAYTGRKYLALFRPDAPDGQALRRRYPDCKDLPQQVERICMNRALIRRYDVGGFDQDLEHQMLQTEIEYRLHRSNGQDAHHRYRRSGPGFAARPSGLVEEADGLGSQSASATKR